MKRFSDLNQIDISKLEVFFQPAKKTKKQTVVFAHGFSVFHSYFQSFYKTLTDYDYYAPLWPGHNVNGFDYKELSPIHYGELLAAFIENKDLEKIVLIGHSMGAAVCSYAMNLLNAKRVEKLILLAPLSYCNLLRYFKIKSSFKKDKAERMANFKAMFQTKFSNLTDENSWENELSKHSKMAKKLSNNILKELPVLNKTYKNLKLPVFLVLAQNDLFMPTKLTLSYFNKYLIKNNNLQSSVILNSEHQMFNSKYESFCKAMDDILNHNKLSKIY